MLYILSPWFAPPESVRCTYSVVGVVRVLSRTDLPTPNPSRSPWRWKLAPAVGSMAPDFTLPSNTGRDISLNDLLKKAKHTVLYFYPGEQSLASTFWHRFFWLTVSSPLTTEERGSQGTTSAILLRSLTCDYIPNPFDCIVDARPRAPFTLRLVESPLRVTGRLSFFVS